VQFSGFNAQDFNVFQINGLNERMDAIKRLIRPKFQQLDEQLTPFLSALTGQDIYPHIAKHARRTVNPPDSTWIAFAASKRGYKKYPHFQIGLWRAHIFLWFACFNELEVKSALSASLLSHERDVFNHIPSQFVWSLDHTVPAVIPQETLSPAGFHSMVERLGTIKKSELLCGLRIDKENEIAGSGEALLRLFKDSLEKLLPLYKEASECMPNR